jgi:hypothetical protein
MKIVVGWITSWTCVAVRHRGFSCFFFWKNKQATNNNLESLVVVGFPVNLEFLSSRKDRDIPL